jgi:SecD/SecF fusion protein
MELTIKVPYKDILLTLSDNNSDKIFTETLARTDTQVNQSVSEFLEAFKKGFLEANPQGRLANVFSSLQLNGRLTINSSNEEVMAVLQTEIKNAINISSEILRKRLINYGIPGKSIDMDVNDDLIHLKLKMISDPERVKRLLTERGRFEFWETYENKDLIHCLADASNFLKIIQAAAVKESVKQDTKVPDKGEESLIDKFNEMDSQDSVSDHLREFRIKNPLFGILTPNISHEGEPLPGAVIGYASPEDTAKINTYMRMRQIRLMFPKDLKLMWGMKPYPSSGERVLYEVYAIKVNSHNGEAPINGKAISNARAVGKSGGSSVVLQISMNPMDAETWSTMTYNNIDHCIAITLDGYVIYCPRVMAQIKRGNTEISCRFTLEEAMDLAIVLRSGELPFKVQIVQEKIEKKS